MKELIEYVPKKIRPACRGIFKDGDGYWCHVRMDYRVPNYYAENTIHEDNLRDFLAVIRTIERR